jgi:hypothetical protein
MKLGRSPSVLVDAEPCADVRASVGMPQMRARIAGRRVVVVGAPCSDIQVGRSDAEFHVASVAGQVSGCKSDTGEHERRAVGRQHLAALAACADGSVARSRHCAPPEPTVARFVDLRPKTVGERTPQMLPRLALTRPLGSSFGVVALAVTCSADAFAVWSQMQVVGDVRMTASASRRQRLRRWLDALVPSQTVDALAGTTGAAWSAVSRAGWMPPNALRLGHPAKDITR